MAKRVMSILKNTKFLIGFAIVITGAVSWVFTALASPQTARVEANKECIQKVEQRLDVVEQKQTEIQVNQTRTQTHTQTITDQLHEIKTDVKNIGTQLNRVEGYLSARDATPLSTPTN